MLCFAELTAYYASPLTGFPFSSYLDSSAELLASACLHMSLKSTIFVPTLSVSLLTFPSYPFRCRARPTITSKRLSTRQTFVHTPPLANTCNRRRKVRHHRTQKKVRPLHSAEPPLEHQIHAPPTRTDTPTPCCATLRGDIHRSSVSVYGRGPSVDSVSTRFILVPFVTLADRPFLLLLCFSVSFRRSLGGLRVLLRSTSTFHCMSASPPRMCH